MRHLLNTLYVLTPENFLCLDNENIIVKCKEQVIGRFPIHTIESIFLFTYAGATPALMGACAKHGIGLSFYSPEGRFLAKSVGRERGNVIIRARQYEISVSEELSCQYGKNFILGKIYNTKWVIERMIRDHPNRVPTDNFKSVSLKLSEYYRQIDRCDTLESLQGIEGKAAQIYFECFDSMILQQKDYFIFKERNRRPPKDRVNALLSFTYSILERDCESALEGVGLDPYIGFVHRLRPGRCSLALDLIEELRASYADRFVLYCINQRIIQHSDFDIQDSGGVVLSDSGRKKFFTEWQKRKLEQITHPFTNEKIQWGLVPYLQALLLARTLRGDLDEYPPFLWK